MSVNHPKTLPRDKMSQRGRPKLWVEGSQQPRFDLQAFARVSLTLSRRSARPVLLWLAGLMAGAARRTADNRLGPYLARQGRLGRALPKRATLASGFVGVAALLSAAADVAVPPPPVVMPPAFPKLMRPPIPRPRRAASRPTDPATQQSLDASLLIEPDVKQSPEPEPEPAPEPAPASDAARFPEIDAETLAAIRAMIADLRDVTPVVPRHPNHQPVPPEPEPIPTGRALLTDYVPLEPPEPREPALAERLGVLGYRLAAGVVGWGTTVLTLPVGAARAIALHLNGEDLRTWF